MIDAMVFPDRMLLPQRLTRAVESRIESAWASDRVAAGAVTAEQVAAVGALIRGIRCPPAADDGTAL